MAITFDSTKQIINVGQEFQSGLAVADWNGVFPTDYVQKQADELWSMGVRHVAMAAPGLSSTWVRDTLVPVHLQFIEIFLAKGFDVDWGTIPSGGTNFTKIDQWLNQYGLTDHFDAFQALVTQYGSTGSRWILGNENEASWNRSTDTASSFTRASNIATVTLSVPHNLIVGDSLTVDSVYGSVTEITDTYNFKQNNVGADETKSATVAIGDTTVGRMMSRAAQSLKARPGATMQVVYRCSQGKFNGTNYYFELMNNGGNWYNSDYLDTIDVRSVNIYGEGSTPQATYTDFKGHVDKLITEYGANAEVSEVGLFSSDSTAAVVPRDLNRSNYWFKRRIDYLETQDIKYQLFAYIFQDGSSRNHLSMTRPPRYDLERGYTPIFDYWSGRSKNSVQKFALNGSGYNFRLTNIHKARRSLDKAWTGSLYINNDGDSRNLTSGYSFSKSESYGWCFYAKLNNVGADKVNTVVRFGASSTSGYRIIIERTSSVNYFVIQCQATSSSHRYVIPTFIDTSKWHHYAITWQGAGSSATIEAYVDGRLLTTTSGTITWSNLVAGSNLPLTIGYEWNVQTIDGYVTDLMYFENMMSTSDVDVARQQRVSVGASSHWKLENDANDSIGTVNLTNTVSATHAAFAPILVSTSNIESSFMDGTLHTFMDGTQKTYM